MLSEETVDAQVVEVIGEAFEESWYLEAYPDVRDFAPGPILHYILHGVEAGYDPRPDFSTRFYLSDNRDVAELGINPFYHYLVAGRHERRYPRQPGGSVTRRIREIRSPRERSRHWEVPPPSKLLTGGELRELTAGELDGTAYLAFSHDVYLDNVGGVQQCIARAERVARELGKSYLNLSPHQPLPMLSEHRNRGSDADFVFNLALNGRLLGKATHSAVKELLRSAEGSWTVVFHALQGHSPEIIADLLEGASAGQHLLWTHDYFTLCPGHNLLRNGVEFCGAPGYDSKACMICVFGGERRHHLDRLERLLTPLRPHVISPSRAAKEVWEGKAAFDHREVEVIEHLALTATEPERREPVLKEDRARSLKIAYLGLPDFHKGAADFVRLHRTFLHDDRYQFLHLGCDHESLTDLPMEWDEVRCSPEKPDAMVAAVRAHQVDVVFLPPRWPETFNLVCYEAVAAGAKIICYEDSGNIADFVSTGGHGRVVRSYEEVESAFRDGLQIASGPKGYFSFTYSRMEVGSKGDRR